MLINEFQIVNYKSYRDTGAILLSTGFNVFIGKNNGGKTALLEALSPSTLGDKPHRHSGVSVGEPVPDRSRLTLASL
jgi:recombinational DNA repair ATPase RecF